MKKVNLLVALTFVFSFAVTGYSFAVNDILDNKISGKKQLIYDGKIHNNTKGKITKKDHDFAQLQFVQAEELAYKSGRLNCDEKDNLAAKVKSIAEGSFTKSNVEQTAYLYEYCRNNNLTGIGGLLITENGKTVSHFVYGSKMLFSGAYSLPDINKNGFSELVLVSSKAELGLRTGAIDIIETHSESIKFLGRTQVYLNDYVAVEDKSKAESVSYKIFAETGANPTFYRETYKSKHGGKNYKRTKKIESFEVSTDDPKNFEYLDLLY